MMWSSFPHIPLAVFLVFLYKVVVSNCLPFTTVYWYACPILGRGSHKAVRRCKPDKHQRQNGLLPDGS